MHKKVQLVFITLLLGGCLSNSRIDENSKGLYKNDHNQYLWLNKDTLLFFNYIGSEFVLKGKINQFKTNSLRFDCLNNENYYDLTLGINIVNNKQIDVNSEDTCLIRSEKYLGEYNKINLHLIKFDSIKFSFDSIYNANVTIKSTSTDDSQELMLNLETELTILLNHSDIFESRKMKIPMPKITVYRNGQITIEKQLYYMPVYFKEIPSLMYKNMKHVLE